MGLGLYIRCISSGSVRPTDLHFVLMYGLSFWTCSSGVSKVSHLAIQYSIIELQFINNPSSGVVVDKHTRRLS